MERLLRYCATGAVCLAAVVGSAGAAFAQVPSLFGPATPADVSAVKADAGPKNKAAVREQLLSVDPAALGALDKTDEIKIALFPNAAATFKRTGVEAAYGGGSIWEGEAGSTGSATLVVQDGKITGFVQLRGRSYEIAGVGGRAHRVVEIAADKLPPEGPITVPKELKGGKDYGVATPDEQAAAAGKTTTTITVNIGFTPAAAGNPNADASLAIALANKAYKKSDVRIKLQIGSVGTIPNYRENEDWGGMLDALTYSDHPDSAFFSGARAFRDSYKADLVSVVRTGSGICGLGWYVPSPKAITSGLAYSIVSRDCITNFSVAHEMGHNMGLDHDRYVAGNAPKSKYNFGYVIAKKRIRDIMAYNDKCLPNFCERLNRFSNPDQKIQGVKFGVPKGKSGAADASRRLNETRAAISKYR